MCDGDVDDVIRANPVNNCIGKPIETALTRSARCAGPGHRVRNNQLERALKFNSELGSEAQLLRFIERIGFFGFVGRWREELYVHRLPIRLITSTTGTVATSPR